MSLNQKVVTANLEQGRVVTYSKRWMLLLVVSLVIFLLGITAEPLTNVLAFDREAITDGQWWRIISGNLVHLSPQHMLLNLSIYLLVDCLFAPAMKLWQWYGSLFFCLLAVGWGLYFIDTDVQYYVGLSGALYGLICAGLIVNIRSNPWLFTVMYLFVIYRVLSQQYAGYNPETMRSFIGGDVIASAHLFGLVAGNICAACLVILNRMMVPGEDG